ncbi:hypothetical protein LTR56_005459 [Elasticomyces elasticus]|nr:hypothetical protein LTR56_005459 [Elasticomyces elasticus]KAK3665417.1 hypothetical protein LTR22_003647 [Elasticomyces elasticus]KAK4929939.1 hypothetical protein LTR49_003566 [Elasticomyces elasticus]KAK5769251.1 hypothetical protein LTS12_000602 [Elasticomyces elasticus]
MAEGKKKNVLSARKRVDSPQRAVYTSNATNSPLLGMPPEIRNRIWTFVLGGRDIHVTASELKTTGFWLWKKTHFPKLPFRLCICWGEDVEGQIATIKASQTKDYRKQHSDVHKACFDHKRTTSTGLELGLPLLEICRQVHQEAALLPFAENHFSFATTAAFDDFIRLVLLHQARTLQHISLVVDPPTFNLHPARQLLKSKLQGLKHLKIYVELPRRFMLEEARISQNIAVFEPSPIESASVVAYYVDKRVDVWRFGRPPWGHGDCVKDLRRWERKSEQSLLIDKRTST